MLNFFKAAKKERVSVGLDIGSSAIKAVKLKFSSESVELTGFTSEPSEIDPIGALKKIRESLGADTVNISVSGPATVIRYVTFPKMSEAELHQALKFEAQKHIPFPVADVNLDGFILKDGLSDNKMLVLLAAAKKEIISQRIKTVTDAGIKVLVTDIDALALINAFNFNYPQISPVEPKAVALLNIGASISNLSILEGGSPRLSRDMHFGGNNFTQKIADIFAIDFKAAELLKLKPDNAGANKVGVAIDSVLTNLATEIRTSFDFYESQSASSVTKIFLSGGAAQFSALKEMLSSILGMDVEVWDPLKKINISPRLDPEKLKVISGQFTVAIGLGLR
ncbi:MAG: type IV pilus assembly protein PilM [Candidatus Omnitrophota bacterium]|jgi:type IV pilus assembly protein PilM